MPKLPDARAAAPESGAAHRSAPKPGPAGRSRGAGGAKAGLNKPSLAAIVAAAAPPPVRALPKPRAVAPSPEIVTLDMLQASWRGGSTLKERARQMSVYLEPPVYDQLRDLAHTERTKMHVLMLEALDGLFRQRGARSIAQLTESDEI